MDQITLQGMTFYGYHGVLSEETTMGQRFIANVWLECDLREAAETDDVRATIDYSEVYGVVKGIVEGAPKRLIETVAGAVANELLHKYDRLMRVTVEIEKPGAPIRGAFDQVSVKVTRSR